jgi:hypothetical protein
MGELLGDLLGAFLQGVVETGFGRGGCVVLSVIAAAGAALLAFHHEGFLSLLIVGSLVFAWVTAAISDPFR